MNVPDVSARPMRRDAQRNQELVLDAAREVISEYGTEASMELVASRAGVGVGTVYRRFPNKEALIAELVRRMLGELIASARELLTRADGTGLEAFLRVLGQSCAEHRGYAEKVVGPAKAESAPQLYELLAELLAQAQQYHRIGPEITIGDIRATSWAIRGIVHVAGAVAPEVWQRHLDIHLVGLRATSTGSTHPSLNAEQLAVINSSPELIRADHS